MLQTLLQSSLHCQFHRLLSSLKGVQCFVSEVVGEIFDFLFEILSGEDMDNVQSLGLSSTYSLSGEDEPHCHFVSNYSWKHLGASEGRNDTQVNLR